MTKATTALAIRKRIGDVPVKYWVRCWKDGAIWVGPVQPSERDCEILMARLKNVGYAPVRNGNDRIIEIGSNPQNLINSRACQSP